MVRLDTYIGQVIHLLGNGCPSFEGGSETSD